MSAKKKQQSLIWEPPARNELLAAFDKAFESRPDVATLTIILKLLTQRGTEALLHSTQMRVTNMLHDVTARFFHDPERIDTGETYTRLIDAIVDLISDLARNDEQHAQAVAHLRACLEEMSDPPMGTNFVQTFIASAASADPTDPSHSGWSLLQCFLQQWYTTHADKKMLATIENAVQATKTVKVRDAEWNIKKDAHGQPITQIVQTYTAEQVTHIKLALTLRRALVERHTAQVVTTRSMAMVVLALRRSPDTGAFAWLGRTITQRFTNARVHAAIALFLVLQVRVHVEPFNRICTAINQRCAGNQIHSVIAILVELVARHMPAADDEPAVIDTFRDCLYHITLDMEREKTQIKKARQSDETMQPVRPVLLRLVDALVCHDEDAAMMPLHTCLKQWYGSLTKTEWAQRFSPDDRRHMTLALEPTHQHNEEERRVGMGLLLQHWLDEHCTLSTDVLLLVSLSEKAVRRIGDGTQLLFGILSNCYGEVCSIYQYPLSGELREGIFVNRGGAILGWCQLVADYVAEQDTQRPGNTPPPRKKSEPKNVCKVDVFKGNRVVCVDLIYWLWKREDTVYKEAVATAAPVGPEAGKTLGNPNAHKELRRQFAGNRRRRTTILGRGVIGKKGARRMKTWLLSPEERKETLTHLEVLLYP